MEKMKINKDLSINVGFAVVLVIFTIIVFHLSVNAFTIVMSLFATGIFALILLYKDEQEESLDDTSDNKDKKNTH